ncbi:polysaccharide biosynthesis/export family protein [Granulicella sp. S156]|jgi:polysaccharide biosynthesis/export protein|uniref:polysaccharide biosynthesis/export family protein n=1 Tax=Granulicella sp. S156 TaxID=1747224 RepID=UPI00131B6A50|nr:polysaccharide biosynthesis/export family protein [Granulicella sp. S156]
MKNPKLIGILLVFIFSIGTSMLAQKESLLIGHGDILHIQVYDTPEMEQRARVTDSGDLPLSFLGNVKVAGMTPGDAANEIEHRLIAAGIMVHPQVTIRVDEYATQNVSVMGQVLKPGPYEIDTRRKVIDVLALAGGLTAIADRHITIERYGDPNQKVQYYYSNVAGTALQEDPMVYPGDTVIVPEAAVVYVLGDVSKPGGYPINTNDSKMTVLQAIALAGYANHTAAVGRSKLVRKTPTGVEQIDLPVGAMEKGKTKDIALLPDDVVYVPFSALRNVMVNGSSILASATSAAIYIH